MRSLHLERQSLLEFYIKKTKQQQSEIDLSQLVTKLDIDAEIIKSNKFLRHQARRTFSVKKIVENKSPVSSFPTSESSTFKEHFSRVYGMETNDDKQPLVEVDSFKINMNFILRNKQIIDCEKDQSYSKNTTLFIGEHLKVLPFHSKSLFVLSMIPAIFHRSNSLMNAEKLRLIFEKSFVKTLQLEKVIFILFKL